MTDSLDILEPISIPQQSAISKFCQIFSYYFAIGPNEDTKYSSTHYHIGSYAAIVMSIYNTAKLKQKIIKSTIHITKSNNLYVVRFARVFVAGGYFVGLFVLWCIPSFFAELAVRVYCATENAMTNVLLDKHLQYAIFKYEKIDKILGNYKINVII